MPAPLLHFLPSLARPYPLCGVTDAALVTMQPVQVTCPACTKALSAFKAPGSPVETSGVSDPAVREQRFLMDVRAAFLGASWLVYHTHNSAKSDPGFPDLVLAKPGRPLVFAELKTRRGKLTRAQAQWITTLAQVERVVSCVWRPADMPAIQAFLAAQRDRVQERQNGEQDNAHPEGTARLNGRGNGQDEGAETENEGDGEHTQSS